MSHFPFGGDYDPPTPRGPESRGRMIVAALVMAVTAIMTVCTCFGLAAFDMLPDQAVR